MGGVWSQSVKKFAGKVKMGKNESIQCPKCLSAAVARIFYGLPAFTPELEAQLEKGEVHLGGCVIRPDNPEYHCNGCGHDFSTER